MQPFRVTFALAALYNFAFGCWAGLFPRSFFDLFDLCPPRYPSIWACAGMIVGLYGLAYAAVARDPERGDLVAWIGLAGKVLGPIGWLHAVHSGELPPRTFPLILANDLVWWFPFLFYLLRRRPRRDTIIAGLAVAFHALACAGLLATRGGNEAEADMARRAAWVTEHAALWVAVWVLWAVSSLSLLAFVAIWARRLLGHARVARVAAAGCALCALGILPDLAGEWLNIAWLTSPGTSVERFAAGARTYTILGAGIANGLYCAAGLVLGVASWRARFLRGAAGCLGIAVWAIGLTLTVAAVLDHRQGMVAAGAATMGLFLPWAAWMGWRWRFEPGSTRAPCPRP